MVEVFLDAGRRPLSVRTKGPAARFAGCERGVALLEALAVLGLLVAAAAVTMGALVSHSLATRSNDSNNAAINLVKTQLEDIKKAPYNNLNCYPMSVEELIPTEQSPRMVVTVSTTQLSLGIQQVTVTATRSGNTLLSVQMIKANLDTSLAVSLSC